MQTFVNGYFAKMNHRELCKDLVFIPADLHGEIHQEDGIWRLNYSNIINPIEVRLGLNGLGAKLVMKYHNTRSHWLFIIISAGFDWLHSVTDIPPGYLRDVPGKLLPLTQYNLPVWDFIGFLFYHGMVAHEWKRAVRTSDGASLDWLWQYNILLYGPTGKNNYKMGCLRATMFLNDSEPNVKNIFKMYRSFSRTGRASCGEGWDDLNEVNDFYSPVTHPR